MNKLKILGITIGVTAMSLAWFYFSWKLTLILMLALWSNNIEQKNNK